MSLIDDLRDKNKELEKIEADIASGKITYTSSKIKEIEADIAKIKDKLSK